MSEPGGQRRIRSFVLRHGRMTIAQRRALEDYWPLYGCDCSGEVFDPRVAFGRPGPLIMEIGFGMGQSLLAMAQAAPETNFLGVEVHRPGVGKLLHDMVDQHVHNIRIFCHDAVDVLNQCIAPGSLDGVQIYFPDPWHKKRHHKRRLIQSDFVSLLCERLAPGGYLHLATDWENYAEQMMTVLTAETLLINRAGPGKFSPRPAWRPETRFERRGYRLGHGVWDLLFERRGLSQSS